MFSREKVSQTVPYSIMVSTIGFTNELKNRIRSLKGRFFLMFLRTPLLCDTFLHNVSIWSLIFKLLSTVDLTVSCNVRGGGRIQLTLRLLPVTRIDIYL